MARRVGKVAQLEAEAAATNVGLARARFEQGERDLALRLGTEAQGYMRTHGLKSVDDCLEFARHQMRSAPKTPEQRWQDILANPKACFAAKEMAKAALAKVEDRTMEREPGSDDEPVESA